jgi:polar amino acid transport system substrate-binding protein
MRSRTAGFRQARLLTLTAGAAAVIALAGCANPDDGAQQAMSAGQAPTVVEDPAIASMVPPDVAQRGSLTVAVNPSSPPIKFLDADGSITGFTPELLEAAAVVMGIELAMQQTSFDALIPGLESERFDIILSINDIADRRAKTDFIDYLRTGTAMLAGASATEDSIPPEALCGRSVGFVRGNVQQDLVEAAAQRCAAAGQPQPQGNGFGDINAAILAVQSGQVELAWGDAPSISYNAEQNPTRYKLVYREVSGIYGVGVNNSRPELRDALRAGLLKCVENGTYDHLLQKYGLTDYRLPEMPINTGPADDGA